MDKYFNKQQLTYIIIAIILVIGYVSVEIYKISYKEKIRQENIQNDDKQKYMYNLCLENAEEVYLDDWKGECKSRKLKEDCSLPIDVAKNLDKRKQDAKKECHEIYKNKAFEE